MLFWKDCLVNLIRPKIPATPAAAMKTLLIKRVILLVALIFACSYCIAMLRVFRLKRLPRLANRKPINLTAPIYRRQDFARLQEILDTDLSDEKSQIKLENIYFQLVSQQHIECPFYQRIGDAGEGGWDICFTTPFDIRRSKPCVAFSFGVDNVFAYDDELADKYDCKVYMFDPSMTDVADHKRRSNSWFYQIGMSPNNTVLSNGWRMRTLCTLINERLPPDGTVDILKVDIEHWEWVSFEAAVREGCLNRVKQLMFESHTTEMLFTTTDYTKLVRVFAALFRLGFRSWRSDENPMSRYFYSTHTGVYRACCYEHYMLNTKFISGPLP